MKKILIFSIVLALWCNFGVFAQDISTGKIPQVYTSKPQGQNILRDRAVQNNFGDILATQGFTYGAQTGNTETVQLPSGVIGTLAAWTTGSAYASGMTSNGTNYYIIDVGDSLWSFNSGTGAVTYLGILTASVGANGIAYNPANGMYYLCNGTNLYTNTNVSWSIQYRQYLHDRFVF